MRLSVLLGEFSSKIVASELLCPDNSSCLSLGFTPKDREPVLAVSSDGHSTEYRASTV